MTYIVYYDVLAANMRWCGILYAGTSLDAARQAADSYTLTNFVAVQYAEVRLESWLNGQVVGGETKVLANDMKEA